MADSTLSYATAREIAEAVRSRRVSPVEVLEGCLARIDEVDGRVNAVIWRNDDEARAAARSAEDAVVHTDPADLPPFHGVPIPIKDLTAVAGWPVTYGSWAAPEGVSGETEMIVDAFRRAGFVLTARTNTPEFGPITAAENDRYGITRNPWDLDRIPGGSSGGSAVAVLAGLCPLAIGTDAGGSIRIPASFCGILGFKPSFGRVAAYPPSAFGDVAHVGPMARSIEDAALMLDAIKGPDSRDWHSLPDDGIAYRDALGGGSASRPLAGRR
ncbi:MAG: amidase, partial [Mycobacterium sp.]